MIHLHYIQLHVPCTYNTMYYLLFNCMYERFRCYSTYIKYSYFNSMQLSEAFHLVSRRQHVWNVSFSVKTSTCLTCSIYRTPNCILVRFNFPSQLLYEASLYSKIQDIKNTFNVLYIIDRKMNNNFLTSLPRGIFDNIDTLHTLWVL